MPKNKKASSSDSESGPADPTPAKKVKPTNESKEEAEEGFPLNDKRRVTVNEFKGRVYVNIREYYEKDGKMFPGKKGISLTVPEWKKLLEHADAINDKTKKF
ncbi:RNA polymerase II transcriptional coactivator [Anopheles ziemanni]|uniref:RNA polymerase II transcriptional coactivator n=1 Tax=Anopheles coustani TaxID=139045 RepID=UPI0026593EAA|nr:RNA polymerase II transcriptional coactivator [Anopheles coustani]XP_058171437.1 RNA polymerase II transcriptional coactivator [Anopheles ziemanni]